MRKIDKQKIEFHLDRYLFLFLICIILIISAFVFDTKENVAIGLIKIIEDPDFLIADYFGVGGIGASFLNSGILMFLSILLLFSLKIEINGAALATVFTVTGFGLFGKNILNVWFIVFGVFIYSYYQKEKFKKYVYIALFGTTLAPVVTQIMFGFGKVNSLSIILGASAGIIIGFILPPLSTYLLRVHQGYNLYNIGFTGGIIGTIVISLFRSYGVDIQSRVIWTQGNNFKMLIVLILIFTSFILTSFYMDRIAYKDIKKVYKYKGRLISDFVMMEGFPVTLINMAINGAIATAYILIVGGDLNGPTIGGIFTIVGFGAFGKHAKNMTPLIFGVFLAGSIGEFMGGTPLNSPGVQLAALFSTTLAPIAGEFGVVVGIVAGMLHEAVSLNIGYVHGGFNLYNNGFAGGLVSAFLIPLIESLKRRES